MPAPPLDGAPTWTPVPHPALAQPRVTFLQAQPPEGLQVAYFTDPAGHLRARAWFGPHTQGPPGHAHGGSMAALLDEVVGGAAWIAGHPVVAATLQVRFRAMLPLHTVVTATGRVVSASGRRVRVSGELVGPSGTVYADAEGLFVAIDPDRLPPMPEAVEAQVRALVDSIEPSLPAGSD